MTTSGAAKCAALGFAAGALQGHGVALFDTPKVRVPLAFAFIVLAFVPHELAPIAVLRTVGLVSAAVLGLAY